MAQNIDGTTPENKSSTYHMDAMQETSKNERTVKCSKQLILAFICVDPKVKWFSLFMDLQERFNGAYSVYSIQFMTFLATEAYWIRQDRTKREVSLPENR